MTGIEKNYFPDKVTQVAIKNKVDNIKATTDVTKSGVDNMNSKQDEILLKIQNGALKKNIVLFDKPGTYIWTCPEGVTVIVLTMFGGGGSGAVRTVTEYEIFGGGGGGGAYVDNKPIRVTPGTTYYLVVGAGGAGVAGGSSEKFTLGRAGGATSAFSIVCDGGQGGIGTGSRATKRAKGNSPLCNKGTVSHYGFSENSLTGNADIAVTTGTRFGLPGVYGDRTFGGGAGYGDGGDADDDKTPVAPGAGSGGVGRPYGSYSSVKGGDGIIIIEW